MGKQHEFQKFSHHIVDIDVDMESLPPPYDIHDPSHKALYIRCLSDKIFEILFFINAVFLYIALSLNYYNCLLYGWMFFGVLDYFYSLKKQFALSDSRLCCKDFMYLGRCMVTLTIVVTCFKSLYY